MNIVHGAVRAITETADATTAAAGAVGGAAINGVIGGVQGGVQGAVGGIRTGLSSGSHSTPTAIATLGVVGAAGLVEWPVLLTIGGTALLVHQLNQRFDGNAAKPAPSARRPPAKGPAASASSRRRSPAKSASKKAPPRKAARSRRTRTRT